MPFVIVLLVAMVLVTLGLIRELRSDSQAVSYEHAERVMDADGVEIAANARSASMRGYLLSGDALFLEHRSAARRELQHRMAALGARGLARATQTEIEDLLHRLDVAGDRSVAAFIADPQQARSIWETEARPVQEQLVARIKEVVAVERAAFTSARDRAASAQSSSARLLTVVLGGVSVILLVLLYGFVRASRALVARQRAEQEQTTFRVLEQMPVGIFVLSPQGVPQYANRHAKRLLGRDIVNTSPTRLGEVYQAFEAGTDRIYPAERMPLVRALAGEVSECTDMEIHRGDEVVPLHVVAAPVHDSAGALLYAVASFQDVRELQRVAMRDALTGLANRAAITQIHTRERMVSARAKRPFSVALIDLDRFKSVNDTHGHASGDEVLKRTAAAIVAGLRRSDAVGRWGGEELVVLMPNTDAAGATRAIEKVLADVRALGFVGKAGTAFSVTFSAGVVLVRADLLLYEAKGAGRNRVNAAVSLTAA
ncbi:MAG: diguanylate cyclase [Deltaproteobacteria bacterium]|nr:diguanylate cyclase [Deltaproteobacteria bacterium]